MIIDNPFKNKTKKETDEINKIISDEIPKKILGRNQGFGEEWTDEKENKLQDWLDKISNKYQFDFRLIYASTESLFPTDYRRFVIYG